MTPPEYLIARTEVPVTMGLRVLSVAALVALDARMADPPEERERDMMRVSRSLIFEVVVMMNE